MAEAHEDFAVYRFVQDLFEDLSLTLPSLGCVFVGTVTANALVVKGPAQGLKNKLFLLFADLALGSRTLSVRFLPSTQGPDLLMGFVCQPFYPEVATALPGWDSESFTLLDAGLGLGFQFVLPTGKPLELGPPVHWQQLAQLYGGSAHGLAVLDHFVVRCRSLLPDLELAIRLADGPHLLRAAHTLKGAARGVTANSLAEAALQLEMLGRSGDLTTASDLYKALLVTYDEFIHWVREGQK